MLMEHMIIHLSCYSAYLCFHSCRVLCPQLHELAKCAMCSFVWTTYFLVLYPTLGLPPVLVSRLLAFRLCLRRISCHPRIQLIQHITLMRTRCRALLHLLRLRLDSRI